jgi:octaprenyl-diphosphate synthase
MLATTESLQRPRDLLSFEAVLRPLSGRMEALSQFLREQVEAFEPEVREEAAYCLAHEGKRLRPALVFLSGAREEGGDTLALVRGAAVVEMVHLATLVHDDVLDDAEMRHNAATVAARRGPKVAVLLGDALFAHALHLAAQFPAPEVCRLVSRATRRVCAGEAFQTLNLERETTLRDYYRAIELKTAELFSVSCRVGAYLGGRGEAFERAAETFGLHLGTAYQIFDDWVDVAGEEYSIGKTLGTDLASGKVTLPLLLLFERLSPARRDTLKAGIAEGLGRDPAYRREVERLLATRDVRAAVREAFDVEVGKATAAMEPFADTVAGERLLGLAEAVERYMDSV